MSDKLPREISRGTVTLMGCQIDVIQLDNGQRIVDGPGFERLLLTLASEGLDLADLKGLGHE